MKDERLWNLLCLTLDVRALRTGRNRNLYNWTGDTRYKNLELLVVGPGNHVKFSSHPLDAKMIIDQLDKI